MRPYQTKEVMEQFKTAYDYHITANLGPDDAEIHETLLRHYQQRESTLQDMITS